MTTRRIKAARRLAGSKRSPAKAAAARQNLAVANVAKAENTVARAAAALVARYRELCREHDPVVAWEVAALSLAGSRQDIRRAAREILNASAGQQCPTRASSCADTYVIFLPDGTATNGIVEPKAQG